MRKRTHITEVLDNIASQGELLGGEAYEVLESRIVGSVVRTLQSSSPFLDDYDSALEELTAQWLDDGYHYWNFYKEWLVMMLRREMAQVSSENLKTLWDRTDESEDPEIVESTEEGDSARRRPEDQVAAVAKMLAQQVLLECEKIEMKRQAEADGF